MLSYSCGKLFAGTLQTAFRDSDLSTANNALQKWLKDAKRRTQETLSASSTLPKPSTTKGASTFKSASASKGGSAPPLPEPSTSNGALSSKGWSAPPFGRKGGA